MSIGANANGNAPTSAPVAAGSRLQGRLDTHGEPLTDAQRDEDEPGAIDSFQQRTRMPENIGLTIMLARDDVPESTNGSLFERRAGMRRSGLLGGGAEGEHEGGERAAVKRRHGTSRWRERELG